MKKGDIVNLDIKSLAYGGLGLSHYNNIVIFVKGGLPGQIVKSKILKKKKKYFEADALEIIKKSNDEVNPLCEHFDVCGGCTFQNYKYEKQLNEKQNQINDLFTRLAKINNPPIKPIIGCEKEFYYRNKMEFSYSSNKWIIDLESPIENKTNALGLHVRGKFDKIVDIKNCYLHSEKANDIFKFIKNYLIEKNIDAFNIKKRTGYLKNIIIREGYQTNQISINFITTNYDDSILSELIILLTKKFKEIVSIINTIVNPNSGSSIGYSEKILWGKDYIFENIGEYTYKISSNSFFQTNSKQAKVLYDLIIEICKFKGNEIVYDLYCGTGSIGIYISKYVKMVYGIEVIMSAVIDAIENAKNNNIKNIQFFHGDLINFF